MLPGKKCGHIPCRCENKKKGKPKMCTAKCSACEVLPEEDKNTFSTGPGCRKCICSLPGHRHILRRLDLDRCSVTKHDMDKIRTSLQNDMKMLKGVWEQRYRKEN